MESANLKGRGQRGSAVLELELENHPGAMAHVVGLFARRSYNLEGILCLPMGDGATSRALLLVDEEARLEQVMRQVEKLVDVRALRRHPAGHPAFAKLRGLFQGDAPGAPPAAP
jgi:acetolactate synthase-1/3 small subunit